MNITDQFQQIAFRVYHGRFESVLKKVTGSSILSVEIYGIPGHQATHKRGKIPCFAVIKNMKMIRKENPCQARGIEAMQILPDPSKHFFTIRNIKKYISFFDPPCVYMMKCTGKIDARSSWHADF